MTQRRFRHAAVVSALALAALIGFGVGERKPAQAQDATPSARTLRPPAPPCRATPGDIDSLKLTLSAFEQARLGFRRKAITGYYGVGNPRDRAWFDRLPAMEAVQAISAHLADIGKTLALVYDIGRQEGRSWVCAWLLSANGLEAAATVPLPEVAPPQLVQTGLRVTTREAARAPALRASRAGKGLEKCPTVETGPARDGLPSLTEEQTTVARDALSRVADLLLPPAIRKRLAERDYRRLLILPAGDLSTVPFAALPVEGARALIDHAAIVVLASVEGLFNAERLGQRILRPSPLSSAKKARGAGSLVVGDPDLSKDPKFCFAPLPHARTEAEFVGRSVQTTPLIGPRASIASVKSWLAAHAETATFLYFATHGMADAVNPMDESFLATAGAHLYGRDIRSLRLPAQPLVVMSACQSGLGKAFEGGVFGLARAWHSAGAPQVVMSLWNVDDLATKLLMEDFVARIVQGTPAEFALQEAMRAARDRMPATATQMPDPALWSGFALFGLPSID